MSNLKRLSSKIEKILSKNSLEIIDIKHYRSKIVIISGFGPKLFNSTFYIEKSDDVDNLILGATLVLEEEILTESMLDRVKSLTNRYNIASSDIRTNKKDRTASITISSVYNFIRFTERNFIAYLDNFRTCIELLYADIERYLNYLDSLQLDLSMFEIVDWSSFDPYLYIAKKDEKFNGSWDKYLSYIIKEFSNGKKNKNNEMFHVKICKLFEEKNDIPLELVCDQVVDMMLEFNEKKEEKQIENN